MSSVGTHRRSSITPLEVADPAPARAVGAGIRHRALIVGVRDEVTERRPAVEFDPVDTVAGGDAYAVLDECELGSPAFIALRVDDPGEAEYHALGPRGVATDGEAKAVLEQESHVLAYLSARDDSHEIASGPPRGFSARPRPRWW